jgi:hypothetical protein
MTFTGNSWGECEDGTEAMGCGPQEIFRNCADISIVSNTAGFPPILAAMRKKYEMKNEISREVEDMLEPENDLI